MLDGSVFLSLPTGSIAIRVVIASVAAVVLARLLLRAGLRVPRFRALTAVVPPLALLGVVGLFWGRLDLPSLWLPSAAIDALPVPVRDTYLGFAPMAAPILVGSWATVALVRVLWRLRGVRRVRRLTLGGAEPAGPPARIRGVVSTVARDMHVAMPPVVLVDACAGGATVVGIRRPVLVIDADLSSRLDDLELEGVIAHELAHVKRRDNLMSLALGVIRDLAFFVPGGRWALRQLHAERELAADTLAVATTHRPAALASGLLKVIDAGSPSSACASLMPRGTLVGRVEQLIDDGPPTSRLRSSAELVAVATIFTVAIAAAVQLPQLVSSTAGPDGLAVMWTGVAEEASETPGQRPEARAFQVYRESRIERTAPPVRTSHIDDDPDEVRRSSLRACAAGAATCPRLADHHSLGLTPPPAARMDEQQVRRWQVEPVVSTQAGLSVFWLHQQAIE